MTTSERAVSGFLSTILVMVLGFLLITFGLDLSPSENMREAYAVLTIILAISVGVGASAP